MPVQLLHRLVIRGFQRQIVVVLITRQKTPTFQEFCHPLADPMHQRTQFVSRGRLYPMIANFPVGILGVDSVETEHVEMYVKEQPN